MKTIVVTGGPCSGKTSSLEVLRRHFSVAGVPAVFVEEAGTDLINEGVSPAALGSMLPFQTRVAKLQMEREAAAHAQAAALGPDTLVVCDRGICDGAAYLDEEGYAYVLEAIGLSSARAMQRYDAVFCLESTAKAGAAEMAYTTANNAARSETPEEAAALDDRTRKAWSSHPHFFFVGNEDAFERKSQRLVETIDSWLARYR